MYTRHATIKMLTATKSLCLDKDDYYNPGSGLYYAEKRNNNSKINISLNMHFRQLGLANGTHVF